MKVYMLQKPSIDWVEWGICCENEGISDDDINPENRSTDAECIAEIAGRLCYMSFGKGRKTNAEYLDHIIKAQHFSVLEHANWTFLITGVSRSLTHELVRHRHLSFSQLSQRYVDESNAEFICPPAIKVGTPEWEAWAYAVEGSRRSYQDIMKILSNTRALSTAEKKAIRGVARSVLPNATETKIVVTGNGRAWREFIQKRSTEFADAEIRDLAYVILGRLTESAPNMFGDLVECVLPLEKSGAVKIVKEESSSSVGNGESNEIVLDRQPEKPGSSESGC